MSHLQKGFIAKAKSKSRTNQEKRNMPRSMARKEAEMAQTTDLSVKQTGPGPWDFKMVKTKSYERNQTPDHRLFTLRDKK